MTISGKKSTKYHNRRLNSQSSTANICEFVEDEISNASDDVYDELDKDIKSSKTGNYAAIHRTQNTPNEQVINIFKLIGFWGKLKLNISPIEILWPLVQNC